MKEIFEQYGGAILSVVAILALVSIVSALLSTDNGVVYTALTRLVNDFASGAGISAAPVVGA